MIRNVLTRLLLSSTVLSISSSVALAFNERDVARVVKQYAHTVACNVDDQSVKVVKVSGVPNESDLGDLYFASWLGDFGCAGGSGTTLPQFTAITHESFDSVIVQPTFPIPTLVIKEVDRLAIMKGDVVIEGIGYGPDDPQSNPTKKIKYILRLTPFDLGERRFEIVKQK